jgi:hypothetical protein
MIAVNELNGESSFREWASLFSGKYFAMIAIYADETGTHGLVPGGKEPAPGIYGFMASPEEWETFRKKWSAVLKKYNAPYFHFRDTLWQQRTKSKCPYYGWSETSVQNFIHDLAIVASSGPIPFGGYASIKRIYGGRTDKEAHLGTYEQAFGQFFNDVTTTLDEHFPNEREKVSFFFDENDNEDWIEILNRVIKRERNRDARIGEWASIDDISERGIPCQAADLLAGANRRHTEKVFELDKQQPTNLLGFILSRHGFPKNHPRSRYVSYSDSEWSDLVNSVRANERLRHTHNIMRGLPQQDYQPFTHHPILREHMREMIKESQFFQYET